MVNLETYRDTEKTYAYYDLNGDLCIIEKQSRNSQPVDEGLHIGYLCKLTGDMRVPEKIEMNNL